MKKNIYMKLATSCYLGLSTMCFAGTHRMVCDSEDDEKLLEWTSEDLAARLVSSFY